MHLYLKRRRVTELVLLINNPFSFFFTYRRIKNMPYKIVYKAGRDKGKRFVTNSFKTKKAANNYKKKYARYDVGRKIKVVYY